MATNRKESPIYKSNSLLIEDEYTRCLNWHTTFLKEKEISRSKIKMVLNGLMECYQNLLSHSDKSDPTFKTSIKTYYKNKELVIITSNYVDVLKKFRLKNYLLLLQARNKKQIKQTYINRLITTDRFNKETNEMGLLVLFLIASKTPQFKFIPQSAKYYKFILTLNINLNDEKFSSSRN